MLITYLDRLQNSLRRSSSKICHAQSFYIVWHTIKGDPMLCGLQSTSRPKCRGVSEVDEDMARQVWCRYPFSGR
jgi:hypothetical protein